MARSYDLTDEKEIKEYLRDVETEYQFQCLSYKEADGCHRLAEFRENVKKDIEAAAPLYKENCDTNKYPRSCYKYGQCLLTGQGVPGNKQDLASALKYYEKSCEMDHATGCFNAAQLRMSGKIENEQDPAKAINLYEKACKLKDGEACFRLSGHYLMGDKVAKDLKKAFELAKIGCDVGNAYACNNLRLMYRDGKGTEKNPQMEEETKKRLMKLFSDLQKAQPKVTVNQ